jgi:hypothetical protein
VIKLIDKKQMKKLLFAFPIVALLAAGCNSSQIPQSTNTTPATQNSTQNTNSTSSPTSAQANTSNWQTYASQKYSFQFKYPTDWSVSDASYTYQGQDYLFVTVSSPLISGVPSASRDAYFYITLSKENGVWQYKDGMNLSLLKSDGGAVPVNVSQQYLQSRPEFQIAQQIFSSLTSSDKLPTTTINSSPVSFTARGIKMTLPYSSWSIEKQQEVNIVSNSAPDATDVYVKTDPTKNSSFIVEIETYPYNANSGHYSYDIPNGQVLGEGCGGCLQANYVKFNDNNKIMWSVSFGSTGLSGIGTNWENSDFNKILKSAQEASN